MRIPIHRSSAKTAWLVAAFALIGSQAVNGTPAAPIDLTKIVASSDLVVAGKVIATSAVSTKTTRDGSVIHECTDQFSVDRVIKGSSIALVQFRVDLPDVPNGSRSVPPNAYRVLFLKWSVDHLEVVDPRHPSVVGAHVASVQAVTPADQVVEAVAAVLQSAETSNDEKRESIFVLSQVKNPLAVTGLRVALADPAESVRLQAAAALLLANDTTGLSIAEAALQNDNGATNQTELFNLRAAISTGLSDATAVPTLIRLLHSDNVETRRAAARALARTNTPLAVEPLGTALDDPDQQVRLSAVRGLARITGQRTHLPSDGAFQANEGVYIQYWKAWLKKR